MGRGAPSRSARTLIELAGEWERWIGEMQHDTVRVPSSYRPMGVARLCREFDVQSLSAHQRAILRFEGITHYARVSLNGATVGEMGPWTPYEFDITEHLRTGGNTVEVEVSDWQVPLGPCGAWEAYGGIIRDVFVVCRPAPYIENARLLYEFSDGLSRAQCSLTVFVEGMASSAVKIRASLMRDSKTVASAETETQVDGKRLEVPLSFDVVDPHLWSPHTPHLYLLKVTLETPGGTDEFVAQTGLRDLRIDGERFLLNGEPLILRGVARHDLYPEQGHTLADEQIETDMRMIKEMGANFVRLVHYPHDRRVVETADRLGLLVTEESGLSWARMTELSRKVLDLVGGNLERVVRRDWNSPSLFAILLANESSPAVDFARTVAETLRKLKPGLFVTMAQPFFPGREHDHDAEKKFFDEAGLDFYTRHPYTHELTHFLDVGLLYRGKPFVFTEWGGRVIGQSPLIMDGTIAEIRKLMDRGLLVGHCFWNWADWPEFSRGDLEMEGGIGRSGVVTEHREIRRGVYEALKNLFAASPQPDAEPDIVPEILTPKSAPLAKGGTLVPISLQSIADEQGRRGAWDEFQKIIERFWTSHGFGSKHWNEVGNRFQLWRTQELKIGEFPFMTACVDEGVRPVVVTSKHAKAEIPVGMVASRLHFLGNVSMPEGYPILHEPGEEAGAYTIVYADGEEERIPLRWGYEVAQSNMIAAASRIDPEAIFGERVLVYRKHVSREVYQVRLFSTDVKPKKIDRIVFQAGESLRPGKVEYENKAREVSSCNPESALLLFALTAERSQD